MIEANRGLFPIQRMCKALDVSRSGYYAWRGRPVSKRERENQILALHIKAVHQETDQTYGTPRITKELRESGVQCSANRVARIKQKLGLKAVASPRKYRVTTKAASDAIVSPDLLRRDFDADRPNQKWVSDITYIPITGGHVYLCAVMDLFSRKVVGWSLQASLTAELARDALRRACRTRNPPPKLIFHSDHGCQYTSDTLQTELFRHRIRSSMGRKGDCYDNAVAESFFSTLKVERVNREVYATLHQARRRIADYIQFFNHSRRHSTLGHISPVRYELGVAA